MNTNLNFVALQGTTQQYDNVGAQAEVVKMMNRGDKLSVKFGAKDGRPYAWLESKNVAGFKYELDSERLNNLILYLQTGEVKVSNSDPMVSDSVEDGQDFQFEIMKQFIENGQELQYIPLFREKRPVISATKSLFQGSIFFRIPRTTENIDYLREQKQAI